MRKFPEIVPDKDFKSSKVELSARIIKSTLNKPKPQVNLTGYLSAKLIKILQGLEPRRLRNANAKLQQ
jgi:hypothetical protein